MRRAFLFTLFAGAAVACGSRTQRAAVSAVTPGASTTAAEENVPEYVVDIAKSRFEVWGEDIMSGDHRIRFRRWKARVRKTKEPEIHAEVEMCSAEIDMAKATRILRYGLLECDKYPTSALDATMKPIEGKTANEQLVEGISDMHGVKKKLRFTGRLKQEGDAYRFTAAFVISRKNFNIRYAPAEPFLKDDVRIIIDVVAVPAAQAPAQPVEPDPPKPGPISPGDGEGDASAEPELYPLP